MSAVTVSRRFIFNDFEHLRECGKSRNTKVLIGRLFRKALCYACFTLGCILWASNITVPSGVLD
jgi:hypothetical protein